MSTDATFFVAKPLSELLELIQNMIRNELVKFDPTKIKTPPEELMTIEEACQFLHVSKVTIHKWKKRKLIFSHRIGRKIYFKRHELLAAMERMKVK